MGLLNYYDDRNKIESELLTIWLHQDLHAGNVYKYTRVATKRYAYVGMDKATATTCAYAKQLKYKYYENVNAIVDGEISVTGQELKDGANVAAYHDGGGMWRVDIAVDINDSVMFKYTGEGAPSVAYINSKFSISDFDEDEGSGNQGEIVPASGGEQHNGGGIA